MTYGMSAEVIDFPTHLPSPPEHASAAFGASVTVSNPRTAPSAGTDSSSTSSRLRCFLLVVAMERKGASRVGPRARSLAPIPSAGGQDHLSDPTHVRLRAMALEPGMVSE